MRSAGACAWWFGALALAGCAAPNAADRAPILFEDLGKFHRDVGCVPAAQPWFDQALLWTFAFNHDEAKRSFEQAAHIGCPMGLWGAALVLGPHINHPLMSDDAEREASGLIAQAELALRTSTTLWFTETDRDLVHALAKRYAFPPPADRTTLDHAYADAMRDVYQKHGDDADVAVLFAESLMDLRPWDLWSKDGDPRPETPEIIDALNRALDLRPDHPGALHFLIHTLEASPHPELAKGAADKLRDRVPGSGHLVHMPAHIDIRIGDYAAAIAANERAIEADRRYVEKAGRGGLQEMYRAHNKHFLTWAAMFDGQEKLAMDSARATVDGLPPEIVHAMPQFVEGFLSTPYHVLIRFGRFDDMLKEPEPDQTFIGTHAFWHYGRGVAFANTGRLEQADQEREAFEKDYVRVPEDWRVGNNPTRTVLDIARCMLEGELQFRRGDHPAGLASLRRAVVLDDALKYDEPWGWMMPARHSLGALYLDDNQVTAAEQTYREDLKIHPDNGWSLFGLEECLKKDGNTTEAADVARRLQKAWSRSDVKLTGSCFCRTAPPTQ